MEPENDGFGSDDFPFFSWVIFRFQPGCIPYPNNSANFGFPRLPTPPRAEPVLEGHDEGQVLTEINRNAQQQQKPEKTPSHWQKNRKVADEVMLCLRSVCLYCVCVCQKWIPLEVMAGHKIS